eukprot:2370099-Pleurochrysis_carterae.AAC.3
MWTPTCTQPIRHAQRLRRHAHGPKSREVGTQRMESSPENDTGKLHFGARSEYTSRRVRFETRATRGRESQTHGRELASPNARALGVVGTQYELACAANPSHA